ncbi:MAG: DUF1820 family protein [Deferribacterota bacterium]|nr:DUF1820 family protein [Deferribacterota bacterium]
MKNKKLYRIIFANEKKEVMQLHANEVNPTSFLGLIEVSDIVFIDSSDIIVTPEDDKVRKDFKDVKKTYIPINYIIRIDEVSFKEETPVIRLYNNDK